MSGILTPGLHVTIKECKDPNCNPRPLERGFEEDKEYQAIVYLDYSETSEGYFMLVNDKNEFWCIPTRHTRFSKLVV